MNANGRIAFFARVQSPDGLSGGSGWWITDASGVPVLLAQSGIPQPPGSQGVLSATILWGNEGFTERSGGEDGRRRFLDDRNQIVFAAKVGGVEGIYRASIEGDSQATEEFSLRLQFPHLFASVEPLLFSADGLNILDGAASLSGVGLNADAAKDWNGGKVRLEIIATPDALRDRLGIAARPNGIRGSDAAPIILFEGMAIGTTSRPSANVFEIALNQNATTPIVVQLLRTLAYGFTGDLGDLLKNDPRHQEQKRTLRLSVSDAAGQTQMVEEDALFPATVGLSMEPNAPDNQWFATASTNSSITLRLMLRLSDGSNLLLERRSSVEPEAWTANAINVAPLQDRPAAKFDTGPILTIGTFQFAVSLYEWTLNGSIT